MDGSTSGQSRRSGSLVIDVWMFAVLNRHTQLHSGVYPYRRPDEHCFYGQSVGSIYADNQDSNGVPRVRDLLHVFCMILATSDVIATRPCFPGEHTTMNRSTYPLLYQLMLHRYRTCCFPYMLCDIKTGRCIRALLTN
jgi:hypothetical protein